MSSADFAFFKKYLVDATRDEWTFKVFSIWYLCSEKSKQKIKTEKDTVDVYCTVKKYLILEVKSIDLLLF